MKATMKWILVDAGEFRSEDGLWTALISTRSCWSVASAKLQKALACKTLEEAKQWIERGAPIDDVEPRKPPKKMVNHASHCDECSDELGIDRYDINPITGNMMTARAWCPRCFERLHRQSLTSKQRG